MPKFDAGKAKAATKKSVKGKLPKGAYGGKRLSRTNPNSVRSDKKNAKPIEHDGDPILNGMSVDPHAVTLEFNKTTGEYIGERRMTRREELNSILRSSSSPYRTPRPRIRHDKKALEE